MAGLWRLVVYRSTTGAEMKTRRVSCTVLHCGVPGVRRSILPSAATGIRLRKKSCSSGTVICGARSLRAGSRRHRMHELWPTTAPRRNPTRPPTPVPASSVYLRRAPSSRGPAVTFAGAPRARRQIQRTGSDRYATPQDARRASLCPHPKPLNRARCCRPPKPFRQRTLGPLSTNSTPTIRPRLRRRSFSAL